jgi:CTP:molybdopterin cytidylyltransferase MocA
MGSVAAIVLAAGMSQRMGRLKPLLPFGDRPLLARVLTNIAAVPDIFPILVVTGHAAQEIATAISEYDVQIVHNADYATGGMLSSVQTGVRALPPDISAFLIVLGDQPMVRPATFQTLLATWAQTNAPLAAPTYEGQRGHPVLFSAACAAEILALPPEATPREVVARHAAQRLEVSVPDPAILADVDTPEDYANALRLWEQSRP